MLMLQNTRGALASIIPLGELIARGKNIYCTCKMFKKLLYDRRAV